MLARFIRQTEPNESDVIHQICDVVEMSYSSFARWVRRSAVVESESIEEPEVEDQIESDLDSIDITSEALSLLLAAGVRSVEDAMSHPDLTTLQGIGPATEKTILAACSESLKE